MKATEVENGPAGTAVENSDVIEKDSFGLERLIFFSDAVFAIAITLLALDIRLPTPEGTLSDAALGRELLIIWPKYLSYVISFLVIGLFWIGHHRKFRYIQHYDRYLIMLNLLFLMSVAFVPFPTSLISEYGNRTATIFYAISITLAGLLLMCLWWYASSNFRLISANISLRQRRIETLRTLVIPVIFSLSIGLAYLDPDLAKFFWLLGIPASLILQK